MKKILTLAFVAVSFVACNNDQAETATVESTISTTTMDTSSSVTAYTAVEGDVIYSGNKVRVMRNGQWVESNEDVTLDNGVVVYKNGRVKRNDVEVELHEGEMVNRAGNFFDRTGQAIENAWDATKEGAKDAGKAIKNTAKKVGEKVDDAVHDDKKDNH